MTVGLEAASERVAKRFTRPMRAATSPLGVLTDPSVVCAGLAVVVLASVILYNLGAIGRAELPFVYGAIALPVLLGAAVNALLWPARDKVVTWLGALPFEVDNMNALLNGVAAHLVVRFVGSTPTREQLGEALDRVHEDCFALDFHPEEPEVELVIGVADSKLNPAGANHRRYLRVRQIVDEVLVPLAAEHPIASVRVA